MCFKPTQSETEVTRAERERDADKRPDPRRPWENTHPRGNPEPDHRDVERGLERLSALVGR